MPMDMIKDEGVESLKGIKVTILPMMGCEKPR